MSKMKKIIFATMCMILLSSLIVFAADSPTDVLKDYYEADKNEDIDTMMSLTDFSHVDTADLGEFKGDMRKTLEALAASFDTKSYAISGEYVQESGDDALVFYHLETELEDKKGKTAELDLDFVAVMHKTDGKWKIVYMQPKDTFEQNMILRELTISASESIEEVVLDVDDTEIDDTKVEIDTDDQEKSSYLRVIIVIIAICILAYIIKRVIKKKLKGEPKEKSRRIEKKEVAKKTETTKKQKSPWAACFLNIPIVGVGFFYLGKWKKGLLFLFLSIIVAGLFKVKGGAIVLVIAMIISYRDAKKLNLGQGKMKKREYSLTNEETSSKVFVKKYPVLLKIGKVMLWIIILFWVIVIIWFAISR